MNEDLKYLLQQIEVLKSQYDIAREKEENFNIFSVMHRERDERRLHSRFIAFLLNPSGSHSKKNSFLKFFIELFSSFDLSNFQNAKVYPQEWDKKENNNIDILIIDKKSKFAIIIENKIDARDSNNENGGQLERYYKHVRDFEYIPAKNISVFYLTLDGHNPSNESLGEFKIIENINGQCISYEKHIVKWVDLCIDEVYEKSFIRDAILQYKKLITKMTNSDTTIEERKELKEFIGQNRECLKTTKYLVDNFKHVKWHTIADFWQELETELIKKGFEIVDGIDTLSITAITHYDYNKKDEEDGIYFKINQHLLGFIGHENRYPLFWGIEKENSNDREKVVLDNFVKNGIIEEHETSWWLDVELPNGEKLWLKDFSQEATFNLINPEYRKKTINHIVENISNFIKQLNKEIRT